MDCRPPFQARHPLDGGRRRHAEPGKARDLALGVHSRQLAPSVPVGPLLAKGQELSPRPQFRRELADHVGRSASRVPVERAEEEVASGSVTLNLEMVHGGIV